jgi:hypothetical protein
VDNVDYLASPGANIETNQVVRPILTLGEAPTLGDEHLTPPDRLGRLSVNDLGERDLVSLGPAS